MARLRHFLEERYSSPGRNSHGMDKNEVTEFLALCFVDIDVFVIK